MLGRIAVLDMVTVARAHFPHSFTHVPGLAGSPAWAVSTSGARSAHHRPIAFGATRHASSESADGASRTAFPVTVH